MEGRGFHGGCRQLCWEQDEGHIGGYITSETINTCVNHNS